MSRTLKASQHDAGIVLRIIVAQRGRNPDDPTDRTAGIPTKQRLEPNYSGLCNTLTSVQKDNQILEIGMDSEMNTEERFYKQTMEVVENNNCEPGDTIDPFNKRVNKTGITPTLTTRPEGLKTAILPVTKTYRVRKLTPRECWRLMDFTDEDFSKAEAVNSNSQLYKQAGNSIVRAVLIGIFSQLNIQGITPWNERTEKGFSGD